MIPAVAMQVKMADAPEGAKPNVVKLSMFPIWVVPKAITRKVAMTNRMMNSFHHTRTLLIWANRSTPK